MNKKERKNLLVFGYGLAVILSFVGIRLGFKFAWSFWPYFLMGLAIFFVCLTKYRLDLLKLFYTQWMKVAHLIGDLITGVILSLLFFIVFGSVGIVLRIIKKDLLDRSIEPDRKSYWINRNPEKFDKKNYLRQF